METQTKKFIVIERSKLTPELWKELIHEWFRLEDKEVAQHSIVISSEQHLLDILDGIMKLLDEDYFTMNLDESESVQAMHYYLRIKREAEILNKLARLVQDVATIDSDDETSS